MGVWSGSHGDQGRLSSVVPDVVYPRHSADARPDHSAADQLWGSSEVVGGVCSADAAGFVRGEGNCRVQQGEVSGWRLGVAYSCGAAHKLVQQGRKSCTVSGFVIKSRLVHYH